MRFSKARSQPPLGNKESFFPSDFFKKRTKGSVSLGPLTSNACVRAVSVYAISDAHTMRHRA